MALQFVAKSCILSCFLLFSCCSHTCASEVGWLGPPRQDGFSADRDQHSRAETLEDLATAKRTHSAPASPHRPRRARRSSCCRRGPSRRRKSRVRHRPDLTPYSSTPHLQVSPRRSPSRRHKSRRRQAGSWSFSTRKTGPVGTDANHPVDGPRMQWHFYAIVMVTGTVIPGRHPEGLEPRQAGGISRT